MSGVSAKVLVDFAKYKYLLQQAEHQQNPAEHLNEGSGSSDLEEGSEDAEDTSQGLIPLPNSSMADASQAEHTERALHNDNDNLIQQQTALAEHSDLTPNLSVLIPPENAKKLGKKSAALASVASSSSSRTHMAKAKSKRGSVTKKTAGKVSALSDQWWKLGPNSKKSKSKKTKK